MKFTGKQLKVGAVKVNENKDYKVRVVSERPTGNGVSLLCREATAGYSAVLYLGPEVKSRVRACARVIGKDPDKGFDTSWLLKKDLTVRLVNGKSIPLVKSVK